MSSSGVTGLTCHGDCDAAHVCVWDWPVARTYRIGRRIIRFGRHISRGGILLRQDWAICGDVVSLYTTSNEVAGPLREGTNEVVSCGGTILLARAS